VEALRQALTVALPELRTARLRIRPWTQEDLASFHRIWGDPEVIWWGPTADLVESRRTLGEIMERSRSLPDGFGWAAVVAEEDAVVGNVMLQPSPGAPDDVEIGWHFAREQWGKGYATEAAGALLAHGFTRLGLPRIVAPIVPDNQRSRALARRLGMRPGQRVDRGGLAHDLWEIARPPHDGDPGR
jgi:RimJ/RimL family protein N-acetyltransferase